MWPFAFGSMFLLELTTLGPLVTTAARRHAALYPLPDVEGILKEPVLFFLFILYSLFSSLSARCCGAGYVLGVVSRGGFIVLGVPIHHLHREHVFCGGLCGTTG